MYLNNLMGNNPFDAMQQQGQGITQAGMQAQNAVAQTRGNAMRDAIQAYQQEEAEKKAREQQLLSLGLTVATGGLGGAAAGGATAGEAAAAAGAAEAATPMILQNMTGSGQLLPRLFF